MCMWVPLDSVCGISGYIASCELQQMISSQKQVKMSHLQEDRPDKGDGS